MRAARLVQDRHGALSPRDLWGGLPGLSLGLFQAANLKAKRFILPLVIDLDAVFQIFLV